MKGLFRLAFFAIAATGSMNVATAQQHFGADAPLDFLGGFEGTAFLALVALAVVFLAYTVLARGAFGVGGVRATPPRPDPALQIRRERLARVEIDPDEYERRRLALTASEAGLQEQGRWPMRLFRLGFAGVFLINALVAVLQPQDFLMLLEKSLATNWFPAPQQLIPLIALNDLAIAVVILAAPSRYRLYVYAWTGLWFLAITLVKLLALNTVTG